MGYDLRARRTEDIAKEFWRRFEDGRISEEELLEQLSNTYPEEALKSLTDYCAQPVADRRKLTEWCQSCNAPGYAPLG